MDFGDDFRPLGEAQDIKDQSHIAIAHDGGSGEALDPFEVFAQGLDDNLLRVIDPIHHQPELPAVRLQYDDIDHVGVRGFRVPRICGRGFDLQFTREIGQGQEFPAQAIHRHAVQGLDAALGFLAIEPHQFDQTDLRNREPVSGRRDDQGGDDGESQGNLDFQRRAGPDHAMHIHRASDFRDVGPHHIHTHAAPREIGYFLNGRKAWQKDQIERLAVAHARRLFGGNQTFLYGFLPDAVHIDSGPVVANFNIDLAALVIGPQTQDPLRVFAAGLPPLNGFDSVIHGIADNMRQRILDRLNNGAIELRLISGHLDADTFSKVVA